MYFKGVCTVDWLARSISLTILVLEHHEYDFLDELLPYTCFVRIRCTVLKWS